MEHLTIQCPRCGTQQQVNSSSGVSFCGHCGTRIQRSFETQQFNEQQRIPVPSHMNNVQYHQKKKKRSKMIALACTAVFSVVLVFVLVLTVLLSRNVVQRKEMGSDRDRDGESINAGQQDSGISGYRNMAASRECLIAGGDSHTVGLRSDGTVIATQEPENTLHNDGQCDVSEWTDIIAVSAGINTTVALRRNGTVVAAGQNNASQTSVYAWQDIIAVSAGGAHTIGLRQDGTVVAVGYKVYGACDVSGWTDIVAVSAGYSHSLGLCRDGTVVAVGSRDNGRCDVTDWTDIVAVSAGLRHSVGLRSDGTVVATEYTDLRYYRSSDGSIVADKQAWNDYKGQCDVSDWTNIISIASGYYHTVGLRQDGTVVAVGSNDSGQCNVSAWTDIVAIAVGATHTIGLKSDGTVVATGSNDDNQCEVTSWMNLKLPG